MAEASKILVVDDEESMRFTLKRFLSDDGYTVTTASDCESAIALLENNTFDVAIVDRLLPHGFTGLDIIRDMKKKNPLCQTIMISAYPSFESAAETIQQGVFAYLTKPVTRTSICKTVREAVIQGKEQFYLKTQSAFFHSVFDASSNAIIICDPAGKTVFANPAFSNTFGFDAAEINVFDTPFVPPEDRERTNRELKKAAEGSSVPERETIRLTKDSRPLDVTAAVSLCSAEDGSPVGVLYQIRDITEAKKMERKLAESEKLGMLGQLSSRLAHEISTPLQIIKGHIELMIENNDFDDAVTQQLGIMKDAACRINRLHKDLSEVARPSSPVTRRFSPVLPLEDACTFLTKMGEIKYYTIEKKYDENLPNIVAARQELEQVYMNLLVNASHALHRAPAKTIRLSASCNGNRDSVTIRVEDTGCGIAPEHIEKVFDPFFTTREGRGGTGLGLAVVKSIVERYSGTISVESTLEKGTVFTLRFPAETETENIQ